MSLLPLHGHKIVKISLKERRFPRIIEIYGGLIKTLENNPAEADPTHISKIKRQSYCSTTGKPTHLFRTKCVSLDSV
jgi:uncharacterized protein YdcH (DUF465 family)